MRNVGGDRVEVAALVGPNGNAHVYAPSPADARKVADAKAVFVNAMGFEGWIDRLVKASGTKAKIVVTTKGVAARERSGGHDHDHGRIDPHAWQSVANAKIYVANIRDGLIAIDPAGKSDLRGECRRLSGEARRARAGGEGRGREDSRRSAGRHHQPRCLRLFRRRLRHQLHRAARRLDRVRSLGQGRRRDHPQIKRQKIPAVFMENVTDPRLLKQIANETGAKIGGTLYSDALTEENGGAPTYIDMIRHNLKQLGDALTS